MTTDPQGETIRWIEHQPQTAHADAVTYEVVVLMLDYDYPELDYSDAADNFSRAAADRDLNAIITNLLPGGWTRSPGRVGRR